MLHPIEKYNEWDIFYWHNIHKQIPTHATEQFIFMLK